MADAFPLAVVQFMVPARLQPLEVLGQFGRFHRQRHGQVFRRVELFPVAFAGKGAGQVAQMQQAVRPAHCAAFSMNTLSGSSR
jgi:hypothetical protein